MNKAEVSRFLRPVIIFFILINAVCFSTADWLDKKGIDHQVLMYANLILFILTLIACYIHIKSINSNNAYAFVRGVMLASIMKLLIIGAAVAVYGFTAETKSVYAIIAGMALYIVYTIFEVKGAMRINRNKNA